MIPSPMGSYILHGLMYPDPEILYQKDGERQGSSHAGALSTVDL